MSVGVYADHNVRREIIDGLRRRDIDCLTAFEDAANEADDEPLFLRATTLNRLLLTADDDLIKIAVRWLAAGRSFRSIIYFHQLRVSIGQVVDEVELLVKAGNDRDFVDRIIWLPLKN